MSKHPFLSPPHRRHALSMVALLLLGGATGAVAAEAQADETVRVAQADAKPAAATDRTVVADAGQVVASARQVIAEVNFNPRFLRSTAGQSIDISRYRKGNVALAGHYVADLYVNKSWTGRAEINLRTVGGNALPCFDRTLLERVGADLGKLAPEALALLEQGARCTQLAELIDGAFASFDAGEQRLDVSIPQIAMLRDARGYVDPAYWDDGITAARLGYNANVYHSTSAGRSNTQSYVGLDAGFNLGAWRLRHNGSFSHSSQAGSRYQSMRTSLQRSIVPLKSQLTLGDAYTDGTLFDSVGFRGVQLASDDRMLPQSQRGYAPVIHGIANSNARVQIRQSGNLIYETTVAPGAFEINDLYPTGYGGDLEVIVTEADGSVRVSRVPFAPPVNAVRQGVTRYSATAGQYRNPSLRDTPWLAQGTVQHGFSNLLTGYGGVTLADGYAAVLGGVALNTGWGAVGVDLTHARTQLEHQGDRQGQSLRLSYSKLMAATNTNIALAAYRYSSRDYMSLPDAMQARDIDRNGLGNGWDMVTRARGRLQLTLNQALPSGWGNFYASASSQNYWNRDGRDTQFSVGYSNYYKSLNYGINATRQLDPYTGKWENRVMLTLGIPLGSGVYRPYSSTSVQHDSKGRNSVQQSVTGTLGTDNAFAYGLSASHDSGGDQASSNTLAANASYHSPVARLGASASHGRDYTQYSVSASGGVVAYSGGAAFTPYIGETAAIIEADDAAGARLTNGAGLRIDPWGHALVSNLTPFARNQVEIDPKGLPMSVQLKSTQLQTAPTAGAVVKLRFETENLGRSAVLRLTDEDGKPLPFGAQVFDAQGEPLGIVAQSGRVIVRGLKAERGDLRARWGDKPDQRCIARYVLPEADKGDEALSVTPATCGPAAEFAGNAQADGVSRQ